ncbi:acid ceramidase-like protein, partial [Reticulomyxa filosa]
NEHNGSHVQHLCVGDNTSDQTDIVEYSYKSLTPYNSTSYPTRKAHPYIKDLIYVDKHVQPSSDQCLGNVLNEGLGNIDAKYLLQQAAARLQTGDMHVDLFHSFFLKLDSDMMNKIMSHRK